jgi:hypothetical protein
VFDLASFVVVCGLCTEWFKDPVHLYEQVLEVIKKSLRTLTPQVAHVTCVRQVIV